jgi:lysophospholipase L1-like esterase
MMLALLLAACMGAAAGEQRFNLDRFKADIEAYEAQDAAETAKAVNEGGLNALQVVAPHHQTVFVGSSTFTRWRSLETVFKKFDAIDRGFGGSTIPEITHFVKRVVLRYQPKEIVFYAGTNDIGELHHSGQQVFEDFTRFVAAVRRKLPDSDIFFVSMSVPPSRLEFVHQYDVGNSMIREWIDGQPHLHYIDVTPVMHNANGHLKEEYFDPGDHLHMTSAGYAAWVPLIQTALEAYRTRP